MATQLAGFVLAAGDLSPAALHACKRRLIDSVGCALGALRAPLCGRLRAMARRYPGRPDAAVWGTTIRAAPEMAGFVNGVAIRYLDHNDTYVARSPGHPSDVIAGILATAEAEGAPGLETLTAIAVGYDLYCGFLDAAASHTKGIDQASAAALGVAAGAGCLLHLPQAAMADALSLAMASNVHLNAVRHGELSDWKGCAGPNGARGGVFAALLARDGVTGPSDSFDGPGSLSTILGPMQWQLPNRLEGPRKVEQSDIKTFPVCYHGLSAVEAAFRLRGRLALPALRAIEVETYRLAVTRMADSPSRWAPGTRETADHSIPYVVAVALRDGALTSDSYAPERLADASVHDIMRKVHVRASDAMDAAYPAAAPARLTAVMEGGERLTSEVHFPKGHARNPVSDAELEAKFHDLTRRNLPAARAKAVLDLLWRFETLPGIAPLAETIGRLSDD
ncbi:MAG: MmgE/PrpD family protein [Actinobacteria bacterium]|nr:MmgE/PrpD family protein [Actinomycetota bacterium]